MKTVKQMIKEYLDENKFDGLVNLDNECGCGVEEILECDYCNGDCIPAMKNECSACVIKDNCELVAECNADYCFKPVLTGASDGQDKE